ncbi:MAG: phosphoribosyl-ATP diphosphatase [Deltaproteobacteria bacterium]|nr:phosphoribosyl-ATP diphosphatase [Deltaproteobacteria bacterium]
MGIKSAGRHISPVSAPQTIHKAMPEPVESTLDNLYQVILQRLGQGKPESSYVAWLQAQGETAMLKKIGEEALEVILAAGAGERQAMVHELADLWFHTLVWMAQAAIPPREVVAELNRRSGISGLDEKQRRTAGEK